MLHRTLYASATQSAVGAAFTATLPETPRPGWIWEITRVTVEVRNYVSGAVAARLTIAGRFVSATNQGQNDASQGRTAIVYPGELVAVTWNATRVPNIVQGVLTVEVDQLTQAELHSYRGAS